MKPLKPARNDRQRHRDIYRLSFAVDSRQIDYLYRKNVVDLHSWCKIIRSPGGLSARSY